MLRINPWVEKEWQLCTLIRFGVFTFMTITPNVMRPIRRIRWEILPLLKIEAVKYKKLKVWVALSNSTSIPLTLRGQK